MTPPPRTLENYRRSMPGPDAVSGGRRTREDPAGKPAPLISIVTAVRNRRDTLSRTIDSVLSQSFHRMSNM